MNFTSKRTLIRPIQKSDEVDLFEIFSRTEVFEHFGAGVYTRDYHKGSVSRAVDRWNDLNKGDLVSEFEGKAIARLILFPFETEQFEIGYVLNPDYWRRGLAQELAETLTQKAFELGAPFVTACARESNVTSRHILNKLGYEEATRNKDDDGITRIHFKCFSIPTKTNYEN